MHVLETYFLCFLAAPWSKHEDRVSLPLHKLRLTQFAVASVPVETCSPCTWSSGHVTWNEKDRLPPLSVRISFEFVFQHLHIWLKPLI